MPLSMADVTVVIPAWRAEGTIGRALASIAAQTLRPHEVVVVVDGPEDPSYEAALGLREALAPTILKVFRQNRQGPGAARNRGLAEATSAWIAFLDADDEWLPDKLARSFGEIEAKGLDLVAHGYLRRTPDGREVQVDCTGRFRASADPWDSLYRYGYLTTSTVVARRDALLAAGGFDETLPTAQDFDLWLKVLGRPGTRFSVFPEALTRYHVSPGGITGNTERRLSCTLKVAKRHARRPASLAFRILAVHKEAFDAFRARGQFFQAFRAAVRLPWNLVVALGANSALEPGAGHGYTAPGRERTDMIDRIKRNRGLEGWMLAWVVLAFAVYLVQFGPLIQPILRALGVLPPS